MTLHNRGTDALRNKTKANIYNYVNGENLAGGF